MLPWMERVRFLKTGAEAVAAAVRIARTCTGRDLVLGCGYHGWLDWSQEGSRRGPGRRPRACTRRCRSMIPMRPAGRIRALVQTGWRRWWSSLWSWPPPTRVASGAARGDRSGWAPCWSSTRSRRRSALRPEVPGSVTASGRTWSVSARRWPTAFRLRRWVERRRFMDAAGRTWISSTLATEFVSLRPRPRHLDAIVAPAGAGPPGPGRRAALRRTAAAPGRLSGRGWRRSAAFRRCAAWSIPRTRPHGPYHGRDWSPAGYCSSGRPTISCPWRTVKPTSGAPWPPLKRPVRKVSMDFPWRPEPE